MGARSDLPSRLVRWYGRRGMRRHTPATPGDPCRFCGESWPCGAYLDIERMLADWGL